MEKDSNTSGQRIEDEHRLPPLVYGYRWEEDTVKLARESKRLLRASVAVPGGPSPRECNLKCIFCFTEGGTRNRSEEFDITNDDVLRFLHEASLHALDKDLMNYFFVSEGEPMLNEDFPNVLDETSKLGGSMTVFTNLYQLPADFIDAFRRNKNLFVCGKMYGTTKETTEYLTGVKGSHERMSMNIQRLVEAGLAEEGRLGVQTVITKRNIDEIVPIFRDCRRRNIVPHMMMYRPQGNWACDKDLDVPAGMLEEKFEELAEINRREFGYIWKPNPPMVGLGACYIPGANIYLLRNGNYSVCAGDTRVLGNIREHSIEDAINHPTYEEIRKLFTECPWLTELRDKASDNKDS
ncbi:radical SAM protein [Patescibacteria group bacterium]|nr:radical SAM protein [Patescibacteria group bacterium]